MINRFDRIPERDERTDRQTDIIANLVVKVTPFFDTGYLTNGYGYGHSYYKRRI